MLHRTRRFCVLCLAISSLLASLPAFAQRQMAELHPPKGLVWQRTSPSANTPDGPVLYQILFRSSATPGAIPKISSNFTLTNSLLVEEEGVGIHIGGLTIAPTGAITLCCGQSFGSGGAGGTVTTLFPGPGIQLNPTPLTAVGSIGIADQGVGTQQLNGFGSIPGQVLTSIGPGVAWQDLPAWKLQGNFGTNCGPSPCPAFLGTLDGSAFEMRVMGQRAFRIEPANDISPIGHGFTPNLIGGFAGNAVTAPAGAVTSGATIAGGGAQGFENVVSASWGTVGGGYQNSVQVYYGTVAGGFGNVISGNNNGGTIGGGNGNKIVDAFTATVAGGYANTANAFQSAIGGGISNTTLAFGDYAVVAGGGNNTAGYWSAVGGGTHNSATVTGSTVAGGSYDVATGPYGSVGGGYYNTASGQYSTVPGGYYNTASGTGSFAAGQYVTDFDGVTHHNGVFIWGDNSTFSTLQASADNQFIARASGGVIFYTGLGNGVQVAAGGGSWSAVSDRNVKERFAAVDNRQLLARVLALPITTWNYKAQAAGIRHIGPMAQDFFAAFNVGEDDRHITTIDEGGVALAAIQGLNEKLQEEVQQKDSAIAALGEELRALRAELKELRNEVRVRMTKR